MINSGTSSSYQQIFQYLEDTTIQKDKTGIWFCIFCMAKKSFLIYLDVIGNQPKTTTRDNELDSMVQFILVKFNHIYKKLRPLADYLLEKIMDKFPYLLWNEKTLRCMMDIIDLLATSLQMDTNQVAPEFDVPNTPQFKLKCLDTFEGRESTLNDFTQRCASILQEALKFAPVTTKSHIQNYMLQLQLRGGNIYDHSGVSMVLECVMKHSKSSSAVMQTSVGTEASKLNKEFTNFIGQMNEKYNFVGNVLGLSKSLTPHGMVRFRIEVLLAPN